MESYRGDLARRATTLANDPQTRMKQPPTRSAFDDYGSDFASSARGKPSSSFQTRKNESTLRSSFAEDSFIDVDDSDDDPMLLYGPSRHTSREPQASKAKSSNRLRSPEPDNVVPLMVDGVEYDPHPDFKADQKKALQGLKFKKNKKSSDGQPSSSSTTSDVPSSHSGSSTVAQQRPGRVKTASTQSSIRSGGLHAPFRPPSRVNKTQERTDRSIPPHDNTLASTRRVSRDDDVDQTPRPRKIGAKVPHPTDILAAVDLDSLSSPDRWDTDAKVDKKGKGKAKEAPWPMEDMTPLKTEVDTKRTRPNSPPTRLSPLRESSNSRKNAPACPLDNISPVKGENRLRDRKKPSYVSPSNSQTVDFSSTSQHQHSSLPNVRSFPDLSPLSSPVKPPSSSTQGSVASSQGSQRWSDDKKKAKPRRARMIVQSDDSDDGTTKKPRPFPLGTQVLDSLVSPQGKRGSSDLDPDSPGMERRYKKRARGADEILRELMYSDGPSEDDDEDHLFNDPNLDPARLCPWCDELLPAAPSPHLQNLISIARARSHKDARPTNPLGLHAAPTVFVNVCQRHRFESHQVPLAQQRGWPTEIAWDRLAGRVRRLKRHLQRIIDDVDEDFLPGRERQHQDAEEDLGTDVEDDEDVLDQRPRKGSTFWREVVRSVKKKGARKVAGVREQMSSFSKTQPGYYGELGSVIISQTIYDLFPPVDFPPNSTLPLTPTEFIQHILVPETALHLVMEDMRQTRKDAIKTLRESAQYGVAMFPDDHTEGNVASEAIVKARAAARRKELQAEEEQEAQEDADMWNAFSEDDLGDVAGAQRSRAPSRASSHASVESSFRPRRACAVRAHSIIDDSDSDMSMSSRASTTSKSTKPRAKPINKAPAAHTSRASTRERSASVQILSESEIPSKASKPRPRPRPKMRDVEAPYDTDLNPRTSDAEPEPLSGNDSALPPSASQEIRWGSRGQMERKVRREDGTWTTVDTQRTPKPKKVGKAASGSSTNFALHITKPAPTKLDGGWSRRLRDNSGSTDDET